MEERIIDDEYARGIRLRKTEDGYIDVTDELTERERKAAEDDAPQNADEFGETFGESAEAAGEREETLLVEGLEKMPEYLSDEDGAEEVAFEFPDLDEDDEDLVNLTPEEAVALRRKKAEEEARRKADYKRLCEEGEELLVSGSFKAAELKFEKALNLAEDASEAAVGYWRSKTSDFSDPDVFLADYLETGFESLENDLGEDTVECIKERYKDVFVRRLAELREEEAPLEKTVTEKQEARRIVLKKRISSTRGKFIGTLLPTAIFLILTVVFATMITARKDGLFVYLTAAAGVLFAGFFVAFGVFTNKFVNALRINRANENLSSTEDGEKLLKLRAYMELYESFVR